MNCLHCFKPLFSLRKTKKFCNGTCRKEYWRGISVAEKGVSVAKEVQQGSGSVAFSQLKSGLVTIVEDAPEYE